MEKEFLKRKSLHQCYLFSPVVGHIKGINLNNCVDLEYIDNHILDDGSDDGRGEASPVTSQPSPNRSQNAPVYAMPPPPAMGESAALNQGDVPVYTPGEFIHQTLEGIKKTDIEVAVGLLGTRLTAFLSRTVLIMTYLINIPIIE
ncbi:unnamed protein product [Diabrotica balteata]|uniref:Uncharacterized protein n=1 Tax=Diabrotica balteata TaxID=107213 RepID=A0A9N9SZM1_DIABA|nr:unnamed protein product [Diabrotica balteata]